MNVSRLLRRLCVVVMLCVAGSVRGADDAQSVFDSIYGAKLKLAASTPSTADDVELAKALLESARSAASTPDLQLLLLKNAAELAAKDPAGYDTAIAARKLEADIKPELKPTSLEAITAIQQRRYNTAKTADKPAAGEALLDALLDEAAAKSDDADASQQIYRKAVSLAAAIKSPRQSQVKATADAAQSRGRVTARIAELKAKLKANPADKVSGRELVMIQLVTLDSPQEARKFTFLLDDAELKEHIALADTDPAALTESQCMNMGEWYRKLADTEVAGRLALLARAAGYYQRYLDLHTAEDLGRTKATLAMKTVRQTLDAAKVEIKPLAAGPARAPQNRPQITTASWTAPNLVKGITAMHTLKPQMGEAMKVGGRDAVYNHDYLFFNIDDKFAFDLPQQSDERVFVRVTAWDEKPTAFRIDYDGYPPPDSKDPSFPWRRAGSLAGLSGTGQWVEREFELAEPRFANRIHFQCDLRLGGNHENGLPPIGSVTVERLKIRPLAERTIKPGIAVELVPLIDLDHDATPGKWHRVDAAIVSEEHVSTMLPVLADGDYQLEAHLTRLTGGNEIAFHLPVGGRRIDLCIDGWGRTYSGLATIDGKYTNAPENHSVLNGPRLTDGTPATLIITVTTRGGEATIRSELDGKPFIQWTGALTSLNGYTPRFPTGLAIAAHNNCTLRLDSVKIKMLTGSAVLLR